MSSVNWFELALLPPNHFYDMTDGVTPFPALLRTAHVSHCKRCLHGLPGSQTELDASRLGVVFYCLGSMDLLGLLQNQSDNDREMWRLWVWEQHISDESGSGFKPSPFMTPQHPSDEKVQSTNYDSPHLIMTYTALLTLAMLRDDFSNLDRAGLVKFLKNCQKEDGSFSTIPGDGESDLRTLYCAFAISSMLNDWSGIDVDRALTWVASCRSYEGGYGQTSFCEAHGGITYIALASIYLAPPGYSKYHLSESEKEVTIRWLLSNQLPSGGFCGRTNKEADACYCFWCGGALKILGASNLVNSKGMAEFLASCQFKYGGIAKVPGDHPDPYHTYLSLAALSIYPPELAASDQNAQSWIFEPLDPLLNAKESTAHWLRQHVPAR